jgi:flagellar basal-body rod modification protein FlgD
MPIGGISPDDLYQEAITTSTIRNGKSTEELGMEDFMQLMVAQMTNQDMMNPVSDTEFIAQMAQFSSLQGINTLTQYQLSSYAVSYVGKNVQISEINDKGDLETFTGTVERVTFSEGEPMVYVNGKGYQLHKVMEVRAPDYTEPPRKARTAARAGTRMPWRRPGAPASMA